MLETQLEEKRENERIYSENIDKTNSLILSMKEQISHNKFQLGEKDGYIDELQSNLYQLNEECKQNIETLENNLHAIELEKKDLQKDILTKENNLKEVIIKSRDVF